ncbi:dipeptidase [Pseudogemmobacter blasticus]|uniref:Peptidase M19 n=1 Tax=Fuscovulum blasticum DSM 2131 TaxID=1188250 RepID=A0A2T4J8V8_FUSBL|nr:membrane dipeptidase [Fuscovulum blasticum]PTE14346.1 peptidase M19 [Fuscovulum blasticum DSM 2131]
MGWKRKFAIGAGVVVVAGAAGFFGIAPGMAERGQNATLPGAPAPSEAALALHKRLVIGDWHSDALLWDRDLRQRSDRGHVDLPRLRDGNVALQVFTTVTKSPKGQNYEHNSAEAGDNITLLFIAQARPLRSWFDLSERALVQAEALTATAEAAPEELRVILTKGDLARLLADRAAGATVVGGLLGAEGAHALAGRIENLDRMRAAGFRLIGLTHFFDNELGGSLHGEAGAEGAGLTPFGHEVVDYLIAHQMVIDLAHASPAMAREVLALPDARPIVSHTGIRSHCESPRNFADDILQGVAASGGLVGIGYWEEVTCGKTVDAIADSIAAAAALLGEDHVSLGSDFDGAVTTPLDSGQLASLTDALLRKGMTEATIAKIMGGNMMRYLAETLPD